MVRGLAIMASTSTVASPSLLYFITLLCQQELYNFHRSFKPTEHLDSEGMRNVLGHKAVA